MNFSKIFDLFMFREGTNDDDYARNPVVTTGSIVWGVIIRSLVVILGSLYLIDNFGFRQYWWTLLFVFWFFVAFPAYRQYKNFNKRIDEFQEDTLCGSCKHFVKSSQLCGIYDEHVSRDYIPCEGDSWEPKY